MNPSERMLTQLLGGRRNRVTLILRLYVVFGILIAVGALGYFGLSFLPFALTAEQQTALLVGATGATLAVMSRVLLSVYEVQREIRWSDAVEQAEFLETWGRFENKSRAILEREGDSFNRYSFRSIISKLREEGKLSDDDVVELERALETRNAIVHSGQRPPEGVLAGITSGVAQIIQRIL